MGTYWDRCARGLTVRRAMFLALVGILGFATSHRVAAQSVLATIDLDDADPNGVPDNPFGATLTPEGTHLLVAISGGFDDPNTPVVETNNRVDVIDVDTLAVVGSLNTGLFPEDIAIREDGAGNTQRIYVTNSSDSTISVFDSISNPVAVNTIALPAFSFPFSVVLDPDQDRLFVGTLGGAGDLFIIDANPLSLNFETILATLNVPGGHGRLAFDGPNRLLVPQSIFAIDFSHSDAGFTILDPDNPGSATSFILEAGGNFEFPSVQDCAVTSQGIAYLPVFGGPDDVFVVDVRAPGLIQTIDLGPLAENLQHGVALREEENLLVVTNFVQSTVTLIDVGNNTVVGDVAVGNEPNEVVFSADGSRLFVTNQNSFTVSVVGELPLRNVVLEGPGFPGLTDSVSFSFAGGEFSQQVRLLLSVRGNDSNPFESTMVDLTPPIQTRFSNAFSRDGTAATTPAQIPNNPNLVGRFFYLQAVTTFSGGNQVASNPFTVVVQP